MGQKFKTPETAAFKMRVYFHNGMEFSRFSRDWNSKRYRPEKGLALLERYILKRGHRIRCALIYDKRQGRDRLIRKYRSGTWEIYHNIQI